MKSPTLHRTTPSFDERNTFVPLLLGLISASRRLRQIVRAPIAAAQPVGNEAPTDGCLYFILGLISFSNNLLGTVNGEARANTAVPSAAPDSVSAPLSDRPRGLLR